MTLDEIQAKMTACTVAFIALAHKNEAALKAFDAACFDGDGITADNQRQLMHALLDQNMDMRQTLTVLTRKLVEAPK